MTLTQLQDLGWIRVAADTEYYVVASKQVDSRWVELGYDLSTGQLHVLKVREYPPGIKTRETVYNGKCPDIQTFKHLQTLLGI
jgi:hypothetical protein